MKNRASKVVLATILTCLIAFTACDKLKGGGKSDHTSYIPKDVPQAVVVPKLGTIITRVQEVLQILAQANPMLGMMEEGMKQQMGFDPFNPEELKKNGLNPDKGMAFAQLGVADFILVIPTDDPNALRALLEKYAALQVPGGAKFEKDGGNYKLDAAGESILMQDKKGYALFSNSEDALNKASKLKSGDSLAGDKGFQKGLKKIGTTNDVVVYTNTEKIMDQQVEAMKGIGGEEAEFVKGIQGAFKDFYKGLGGVTGISLNGKRLNLLSYSMVEDKSKLKFMSKSSGGSVKLIKAVGGKAIAAGKLTVDLQEIFKAVEDVINTSEKIKTQYQAGLADFEKESGMKLQEDILAAIHGDPVAVIFDFGTGRKGKPKFVAALKARDNAKASALLEKIAGMAGAKSKDYNDTKVYEVQAPDMKASVALVGDHIVIADSKNRLTAVIDAYGSGADGNFAEAIPQTKASEAFLNEESTVVYLDATELISVMKSELSQTEFQQFQMFQQMAGGLSNSFAYMTMTTDSDGIMGNMVISME